MKYTQNTKKWIKKLFDLLEKPLRVFVTFHARPKNSSHIAAPIVRFTPHVKIAIVVQGPVIVREHFTFETLKIYKKLFPYAQIILSTWKNTDQKIIETISAFGIEVILNEAPEFSGVQNLNYQIVSSRNGMTRAKEMGCLYAMKTRTDQRVYAPSAIEFLYNLTEQFPVASGFNQSKRIVACSLNSFLYRRYGLSDMLQFGHVDDMLRFWNAPLDKDGSGFTGLAVSVGEVYLTSHFLQSIGRTIDNTLLDSWRVFADHFSIADASSLDLYWYKYARMKEYRYRTYGRARNDEEMSFVHWMNMYNSKDTKIVSELDAIERVIPV